MVTDINFPLIMLAALVAVASPGPATLAIAGTSMSSGRRAGLLVASGIMTGSMIWSISAALGLGAIMLANVWVFEFIRYFGAAYLLFLAYKSARSAFSNKEMKTRKVAGNARALYFKGLALHLTNPKAILFFGSLYAIGIPVDATPLQVAQVVGMIAVQSLIMFHGYAVLFSTPAAIRYYIKLRRWFEGAFAIGFGMAGFKILTARI